MRGKFNVKNLIKIIAVVGAIVAIIFSVRYSRKTEEKISQTNNLETTYDGYQRGSWSASVSKSYGGIGPFTVDSYKGGFCMTQGIDIVPKSQSLSLSYSNASVWNIVPNVYGNDSQELEFFRAKYRAAGGSAGNIFYTAQLVIWGFSSDTGLSRYTSSDGNVWADSSSAQITIQNGNQWVVGPFQLYNPSREFLQLNKGSLYLYENNSGSSISSFQIVDAYGYDVTGYSSSVDGWSGSFYFVFNHEYRKGVRYRVVGYYNSVVSYQSQGYIFTGRGNYQPMGFPVRQRYDRDIDVDVSIYENPSKYNMYIVKDGENSQHLPGAEFEMTKQGSSASFYTQGSSKIVTSSEQSPIYNTISGGTYLELTDTTPDIYTINETKAPLGYALLANPITLQINKRQIGDAYEIDSISIKYGDKEVTEIADSNGNQNKWFAIDKDGNAIVLGDEAKYGNGPTDEDNYWIAIQFHRAAGDSYTSAFAIKYRDPRAKYNLEIEKRDEIAGNKMAGAKFNLAINGNQKEIISKNDGEDNEVIEILADNTKEMSEPELIEITEIEAPSGYLLLKKPIIFRAYKTTNVNDEGRIDIEKLQLMKSATEETNTYITEGNSINIDKNGNVNDNNKVANISYSKGKIVVKIYDELRTGSYIVSFGKKKISDLNGYIAGVTYDYTSKINGTQNSTVEKVTGSAPIPLASVSISNENDARQIDEFKLEEKDVGDNDIKLKNYSASIFVHKKISDDGDRYEVDYVAYKDTKSNEEIKITIGQKLWIFKDGDYTNEDPDENRKKDLVAYIDYTDSREIVFVDIDEEKKPFEFNLYKTNDSNESLPNTYFRVVKHEVDGDIDLTQPITESGDLLLGFRSGEGEQLEDDNLIDNVPNRENFPHAYIYEIHETDATNGYVNVFKKDGQEIAYIQVKVYEDEDGNLKTDYGIVKTENCTNEDLVKINSNVSAPTIEGNSVSINIKNSKNAPEFYFEKKAKGSENGAVIKKGEFTVKLDGENIDPDEDMYYKGNLDVKKEGLSTGVHTIEFYEREAPQNFENIFEKFDGVDGIKAKFRVNEDGTITLIQNTVGDKKYNFYPSALNGTENNTDIEAIADYVDVDLEGKTKINFRIVDPTTVRFEIHKKMYTGKAHTSDEQKFDGQADFRIERTSPTQELKFNDTIDGSATIGDAWKFFNEENVSINTTYKYELVETRVSDGYEKNLVNKTIEITVKIDQKGRIETAGFEFVGVSEAEKAELSKYVEVKYSNNANTSLTSLPNKQVEIYISNIPQKTYIVRLHKTDKFGNEIKMPEDDAAQFDITSDGKTRNVTVIGATVISDENEKVNFGGTKQYTIVETKAPKGYTQIKGRIQLNIEFNQLGASKYIKSATPVYYNENGQRSTDVAVTAKVTDGAAPIIDIYVPNDSSRPYIFKLLKYEIDGTTKIVSDNDGDGANFTVDRIVATYGQPGEFDYHELSEYQTSGGQISGQVFSGVLKDGEFIDTMPLGGGFIYTYVVTENSSKGGYENIYEGKKIYVTIKGGYNSENKAIITEHSYKVYDITNQGQLVDCTDVFNSTYPNCIKLNKTTDANQNEVITLGLVNPKGYIVRLNKVDMDGKRVTTAIMDVYKDDNREMSMNATYNNMGNPVFHTGDYTVVTDNSYAILPGTEHTWKVYERAVSSPYYNVFGTDKYIEVKVKMDNQKKLSTSYTIKNQDGTTPSNLNELKAYIDKVEIVYENEVPVVDITIKNPKKYKLKITKYEMDGTTELGGATVTLKKQGSNNEETIISGGRKYYETYEFATLSTVYEYDIKETKTADAYHINVLEGKTVKLYVRTTASGEVTATFDICEGNTVISKTDEIYKYVILDKIGTTSDGAPLVNVRILNPKTGGYKVKLVKTDEKGRAITDYPATFKYTRYNSVKGGLDRNKSLETTNGQIIIEAGQVIDKEDQTFRYNITETQAPVGCSIYDERIQLTLISKDDGQKLTLDESRASLKIKGSEIARLQNNTPVYGDNQSVAWYFDNSGDSVEVTIYVKNPKKIFDLALRKHIESVKSGADTTGYDREPKLDVFSLAIWKARGTAAYYHTKEAVEVKTGDTVKYRIDIFNEAFIKGYATEITDYLEDGLEFAGNTSTNTKYRWKFYDQNGNETEDMSKAKYAKTDYLKDTLLNECQLNKYITNTTQTTWYSYVEIECKVVKEAEEERVYLTNRAEITDHKAVEIDKDGNEIVLTEKDAETQYPKDRFPDRDSEIENVKAEHGNEMFDYNADIDYDDETYYPGYQDDDDKETVTIQPKHEYKLRLKKVDGKTGEELDGARFTVEAQDDHSSFNMIYNDIVDGSMELNEPEASGRSTMEVNRTYTYRIKELSSMSNYENELQGLELWLKVYLDEDGKLHKGVYGDGNTFYDAHGFVIYKQNDIVFGRIKEEDSDLYERISVDIDNNVVPPRVTITIPNEKIIKGSYSIRLRKVDADTGKAIGGIPFKINNDPRTQYTSNVDGILHVGGKTITKDDVEYDDEYRIKEICEDGNSDGYIMLSDELSLTISKDLNTAGDEYIVSEIDVKYRKSDGIHHRTISIDKTSRTGSATISVLTDDDTEVDVEITAEPNGMITIKAPNKKKQGQYSLKIHKVYIDNEGVQHSLSGTKFSVSGETVLENEGTLQTDELGNTEKITREITTENVNNVDTYTIKEIDTGRNGIVGLKNSIEVQIQKYETYESFEVTGINVVEKNENGEVIKEAEDEFVEDEINLGRLRITNVELTDGRTANVYVATEGNDFTIIVQNRETPGKINVKIKKVMAGTNQAISGVTFQAKDEKQMVHTATSGADGIAYIERDKQVDKETTYTYIIDETDIPNTPANLVQLTDFGIYVSFNTKYVESTGKYIIDASSVSARANAYTPQATAEINAKQREIAEKAARNIQVSNDGLELTITIENTVTTDYGLTLRKADMDTNEELADAKFTVKEDGVTIAENKTISEFSGRIARKTNILANTTHVYEIYETEPAATYENIFEKTYIRLVVTVGNDGTATATYEIKARENGTSQDVADTTAKIQEYVNAHSDVTSFLESNGNYFTLNIPNPKAIIPLKVELRKFELGNANKKVSDARFSVRKTTFEKGTNSSADQAITRFTNNNSVQSLPGFTTSIIFSKDTVEGTFDATIGDVYYYEITESEVPTHYKSLFYSALVKVYVQKDAATGNGEAVATIEKIKLTSDGNWIDYSASDYAGKLEVEVNGTSVLIKWANELEYTFKIFKKSYSGTVPTEGIQTITDDIGGANVTIHSSNKNATLVDGLIHASEMYVEEDVNSNTTYTYVINENAAPTGHYNIFKDMDIVVTVRTDGFGGLSENNSGISVRAQAGKTVSEEALAEARNNVQLVIDRSSDTVEVYIANKQIHNTYDIKVLKVARQRVNTQTGQKEYMGIPGIKFSLMGNSMNVLGTGITGADGTLTISGLVPNNRANNYAIAEDTTTANAAGVTPLHGWIGIDADLTGIEETMTADQIAELLAQEVNGHPRFTVSYMDARDSADDVIIDVEGNTVLITIKNETPIMEMNLVKVDESGTRVTGDANNPGASFEIIDNKTGETLWNSELALGGYTKSIQTQANAWYEYIFKEKSTKAGYVNILKGYDVRVHVKTDEHGIAMDPDDSNTYFELEENGDTPLYTKAEILANNWVRLSVIKHTETDEDTGEEKVVSSTVNVRVINPNGYKVQLNKKDKNGSTPLNVAVVKAENIVGADVSKIYNQGTLDERAFVLTQIAHATESGTVHVNGDALTLSRNATVTSDARKIELQGRYATFDNEQTWRITETDVDAPYKNILKDKYLVVNTYYQGELKIAQHTGTDNQLKDFYVIDKDGNDVTSEYADYVEVSTAKIDEEWTLVVTIKNPMIVKVGLYKQVDAGMAEPLRGANLTLKLGGQTAEIKDGSYQTEMLESDIQLGGVVTASITETATVKGYKNILEGKTLYYIIRNNNGNIEIASTFIIDNQGNYVVGEEKAYILSHITIRPTTTEEGYKSFMIYIENPMSYKFDLTKLKIDGTELDGAEITVVSSHSGEHVLTSGANLSFVEEDVEEHSIITYAITEIRSRTEGFVNKFDKPIKITAMVEGGEVKIVKKEVYGVGGVREFDELEYFDCYVDPESKDDLHDDELQTIVIKMENPPQIEVDLLKTTAGENTIPVSGAKFTIESLDTHTEYTSMQGLIKYLEEVHEAGNYTIRVYENEAAGPKYVNVLEGKYMKFDVEILPNGGVYPLNGGAVKFFKIDNDNSYDNDVEITGEDAEKLAEYCSVSFDNRSAISKIMVNIKDPVKFDLTVIKQDTDDSVLEGAKFEITSVEGLIDTIRKNTDENGEIKASMDFVNPGIYEYHVTEVESPAPQYENVLNGNMIVVYVKVEENGNLTLVADSEGNAFARNVTSAQKYIVKKLDGSEASTEDIRKIRNFCSIEYNASSLNPDNITIRVEDPLQTKVDLIKKQYSSDGTNEEDLDGTKFTVIKNGSDMLFENGDVTSAVEIEEHDLTKETAYYDIYENRTNTDGAYVNILDSKFIRVYTELTADGKLIVKDKNGNESAHYFEIYEIQRQGSSRLMDRAQNEELYGYVDVWAEKNSDGIYVLNIKVINPVTIKVGVLKKQYDPNGAPISGVSVTVVSENTGDHDYVTRTVESVFSEGNIKPGTYNFIVKENDNPNPRYVNILKNRYAKANVTVSKKGEITCNNIKFYADNGDQDYTNDALITDPEISAKLSEMVYAEIDTSSKVQKIRFVIENPVTLKFVINKVDMAEGGLEGATFDAFKYQGNSSESIKGMTAVDTDSDGLIEFENGEIMRAGVYRYETTELKPAAEKYVNILDCYDDGSQYKVVVYVKLSLDGRTEIVRDAAGTPYANGERYKYTIVNRNNISAAIPQEVTEIVHKYLVVNREQQTNDKDKIEVKVHNTPQIDIDVIKVTTEDGVEKPLAGTKFSAEADNGKGLFENIPATQEKEYRFKNVEPGRHEFYITESEGVVNGGYINVLENRYVRVYTSVAADGVMKILDSNGNEDADYFEIYDGDYNDRYGSRMLDREAYAKIYECVSVEVVRQNDGVYKLNLKVNNPERNYKVKLNKKVFGDEDINMKNVEFWIYSTVDNQAHQVKTDENGNIEFEEKRVPVGIYEYAVTETAVSGPEFVNVLENAYIKVRLKVNQDGSINIVDNNNYVDSTASKYYIVDKETHADVNFNNTIVDNFVRVGLNNEGEEPELDFYIKDPERYNFKLVKRDALTNEKMNGVTFKTKVYGPSVDPNNTDNAAQTSLLDAITFVEKDISTLTTAHVEDGTEGGTDGVISIEDILITKTGTYTFVFHEESTDGLFEYLYKSHAEDIKLTIDISVETDNSGKPIGYKVGQPRIITGAKYVDDESTLTTQSKAQLVRAEVLNTPIRGHFDLVLNKLDSYTNKKLDGAEFTISAEKDGQRYELYEDVDDLRTKNVIIPSDEAFVVSNGQIKIENIRITPPPYQAPAEDGTLETFNIILTETKAPTGYMLLDDPIVLEVTTAIEGENDDARYVVKSVNLTSGENHGLVTQTHSSNEINIVAKDEYFDLALRKSILTVAYSDSDDGKITEDKTEDRQPLVHEDDELFDLNPDVTTAQYRHVKNHVRVYPGQEVIYVLRVYNEGEIDGYAEEIKDHLPEGLIFLSDDKFNTERGWTYDTTDQSLRTIKTTFLSKENNPNNDRFNAENNLIKALDASTGVIDYKEIEVKCKVSENLRPKVVLTNIAEISESKADGRTSETVDRDSVTDNANVPDGKELQEYKEDELTDNREDYVPGQEDDDDFEKVIVEEFDLALRKYITAVNEEELLADKTEEKYTDKVKDTNDILGNGTASGDAEGTNEGANTNNSDESNSVNAENGRLPRADKEKDMIKYDREPRVNVSTLKSGDLDSIYKDPEEPTTAEYKHTKDPVEVSVGDIVTYTLEVFNEGTVDGYASLIKDDIPEGVEFVQYTKGDGSVNDIYRWKMVDENDNEVKDPKKAKYIISDYLSKENEKEEFSNILRAFDPATGTSLDSKYVQVQFRVICKQNYPKIITNYAQITEDTDEYGGPVTDRDSTPNKWIEGEDDQDVEHIWVTYMDLALRKSITGVTDYKTGITQEIVERLPQVDPTALIDETGTTAKYEHTKEPVLVHTNDIVIYTLRLYNEGSKDGYATQIKDDLPEGLEFLPDHEINKEYEWRLVDANDKPVTSLKDAKYAVTNYRSKENETEERQNLIRAFDYYDYENDKPAKRETPEWTYVKIAFKVTEPQTSNRILINEAQISEQTDGRGVHREDRDSHPNIWLGEDDEDIEKVRVQYFDLALRKWVTKAIVTQDGEEKVFETGHHAEDDPEDIVKVDLKKSKINKVVVKFEYQIRITNEGEIAGYAKEIKDHIPEGLAFDPADNPTWTQIDSDTITTDELKDTLLEPGESAEVTVVLTWINSGDNLGIKVNIAEISKDYNDYGTPDIDSTPNNYKYGEDDIDDAPVMLAVKTGNAVIGYIALAAFVGAIIMVGVIRIKKINKE